MSADPYSTLVPDGQYRAVYLGYEKATPYGQPRWIARFRIIEPGPYMGLGLLRFYNVPKGRFLPRSHNLSLDYVNLMRRRPPTTGLTPDQYKGCEVLVKTTTVKHRLEGGKRRRPKGIRRFRPGAERSDMGRSTSGSVAWSGRTWAWLRCI